MSWMGPRQSKVNYRFSRKHGQHKFPLVQKKRGGKKVVSRRSKIKVLGLPVKARRRAVATRRRRT